MNRLKNWLNIRNLIILGILFLALFFRTYHARDLYIFEHDQDLYSFIVKDLLVDKHPRLIGQVTSIEGVFIGPLFYYLLVPFYAFNNMDPRSAIYLAALIGLFTTWSFYFVFSRIFNKKTGLIGAFIYAVSLGTVFFDRWVVPTQPTILWAIWFLYVLFSLAKGSSKVLPLAAVLMALVWHIHVALIPPSLLLIAAFVLGRQKIRLKDFLLPVFLFILITLPFWVFEFRHGFIQIQAIFKVFNSSPENISGSIRIYKSIDSAVTVFNNSLTTGLSLPAYIVPVLSFFIALFLYLKKVLTKIHISLLLSWIGVVLLAQISSKQKISEYYFINLVPILLLLLSLFLSSLFNNYKRKILVVFFLTAYLILNLYLLFNIPVPKEPLKDYNNFFPQKNSLVDFISDNAGEKGYPCISINYIAEYGKEVGFRYLLWWHGLNVIRAGKGTPVYDIVIPYDRANAIDKRFGIYGLILPKEEASFNPDICKDKENSLIPIWGITK